MDASARVNISLILTSYHLRGIYILLTNHVAALPLHYNNMFIQ